MSHTLHFKIVTPERIVYEDDINQVTIPTQVGEITVLAHHTPIISLLHPGEMTVKKADEKGKKQEHFFAVSSGFVEVRTDNTVIILADTAERAEEIDLKKAEEARERAEKMLEEHDRFEHEQFAHFQALLEKEIARIKVKTKFVERRTH